MRRGNLLLQRFRWLFGRGSEVNRGQEGTDEHNQQIDFHEFLRCTVAAGNGWNAMGAPVEAMTVA